MRRRDEEEEEGKGRRGLKRNGRVEKMIEREIEGERKRVYECVRKERGREGGAKAGMLTNSWCMRKIAFWEINKRISQKTGKKERQSTRFFFPRGT